MWYHERTWQRRLLAERALMRERFPGMALREQSGTLHWIGTLEPLVGYQFRVRLVYPARYPYQEPAIHVMRPSLQSGTPHRYVDGSLCIHRVAWNPATGTAAGVVPLASLWLATYLNWQRTGQWEEPEWLEDLA